MYQQKHIQQCFSNNKFTENLNGSLLRMLSLYWDFAISKIALFICCIFQTLFLMLNRCSMWCVVQYMIKHLTLANVCSILIHVWAEWQNECCLFSINITSHFSTISPMEMSKTEFITEFQVNDYFCIFNALENYFETWKIVKNLHSEWFNDNICLANNKSRFKVFNHRPNSIQLAQHSPLSPTKPWISVDVACSTTFFFFVLLFDLNA